jgi:glycogen synthase
MTFSGQLEDCCQLTNSRAYIVSYKSPPQMLKDGLFVLEHRPKLTAAGQGIKSHFAELVYAFSLVWTSINFKSSVAVIDSGTLYHFYMGALFRLVRIPVVTVLHNTIWPSGFPPVRALPRLVQWLDSFFFRWGSSATIGVSPECNRQVDQLTKGRHHPLYEIRAQFLLSRFEGISPPPAFDGRTLHIMYIGRINRIKGVFDILEMAAKLNAIAPGRVQWEICGTGVDFDALKHRHSKMQLKNVSLLGWISLEKLRQVYSRNHISIIPTRSDFAEGLAMTAAEAILAGRPIISNPVVPALEILRPAALEAKTNDVDSYVDVILDLLHEPSKYDVICKACVPLQPQFYDRSKGLSAVLAEVLRNL